MFIKKNVGFKNSTSIRHISAYPNEDEVLVHRKTKMKITGVRKYLGTYYFTVEEVDGDG